MSQAVQYTVPSQLLLPRNALKKKKWLLLSLRRQELYLINGQTSEAVVCTVNRIKYHSFTVGQRKITTDGMMVFFVFFLDWKCILSFQKSNNLSLSSGMGRIKPVTPTGQDRVMERQRIRYKYKVRSLDFQGIKSQREQKHHQYTSIFKFTLPHSHKHTRAHTHPLRISMEVLKSPQRTLFICFLLPCYIISATTTVAIAGGGAGSIGSITQSCWHRRRTGSRSLHRVTCMLLWLGAVIRILRCPRSAAHGVDLCEQAGPGLVLSIVL